VAEAASTLLFVTLFPGDTPARIFLDHSGVLSRLVLLLMFSSRKLPLNALIYRQALDLPQNFCLLTRLEGTPESSACQFGKKAP
jgi:hypothetical protein